MSNFELLGVIFFSLHRFLSTENTIKDFNKHNVMRFKHSDTIDTFHLSQFSTDSEPLNNRHRYFQL